MDNYRTALTSTPIRLVDYPSAAALIGVQVQMLRAWVSKKRIPHIHVGRLVRFDVTDLKAWLESHKALAIELKGGEL